MHTRQAALRDGERFDDTSTTSVHEAVHEVVRLQAENGVALVNDGEYTKRGWQTCARPTERP